jgi:hypothetical protein
MQDGGIKMLHFGFLWIRMKRVPEKPRPGQYAFDEITGEYTFNAKDAKRFIRLRATIPAGEDFPSR